MRIKLIIQYDGRKYFGWQRQSSEPNTIQEILENSLQSVLNEKVTLEASGRTDAGVSAYAQVAHFDTNSSVPVNRLPYMLKNILPDTISVLDAEVVDDDFHSRFDVKKKTYVYKLYISKLPLPLKGDRLQIKHNLDIDAMKKACEYFIGEHDFTSFTKAESVKENCVRNIFDCRIESRDSNIDVYVTGSGFLHNMVRIIVGTLVAVGESKLPPTGIQDILRAKDRTKAFKTLPPYYLYLYNVEY